MKLILALLLGLGLSGCSIFEAMDAMTGTAPIDHPVETEEKEK